MMMVGPQPISLLGDDDDMGLRTGVSRGMGSLRLLTWIEHSEMSPEAYISNDPVSRTTIPTFQMIYLHTLLLLLIPATDADVSVGKEE
jgi:hypothetical protein